MNVPEAETRRVLIVEDENAAREASKQYLQRQGYAVSVAADAAGAMRQVEAHPPNIVVCDWNLGEGPSGTDFARRLQTRFSVPVIFITARPIDKLRREARDIDVVRFFRKPFRLAALARAIDAAARNA